MGGSSSKEGAVRRGMSTSPTYPQDNQNYAPREAYPYPANPQNNPNLAPREAYPYPADPQNNPNLAPREAYPYPADPQNNPNLAPREAYPYPAYNQQPYNPPPPQPPQNYGRPTHAPHSKLDRRYSRIADDYNTLEEVSEALARAGLESSNLIVGIDFTKSNEWTGAKSFNRQSLHHIGDGLNPYEQAISIIGKTLAVFDEDNLIPCFGFGDASTHDQDVFSFYPEDGMFCNGFEEVLRMYRDFVPRIQLAGLMMGNQVGNQVSGSLWKVDSFTLIMVVDNYWV